MCACFENATNGLFPVTSLSLLCVDAERDDDVVHHADGRERQQPRLHQHPAVQGQGESQQRVRRDTVGESTLLQVVMQEKRNSVHAQVIGGATGVGRGEADSHPLTFDSFCADCFKTRETCELRFNAVLGCTSTSWKDKQSKEDTAWKYHTQFVQFRTKFIGFLQRTRPKGCCSVQQFDFSRQVREECQPVVCKADSSVQLENSTLGNPRVF